MEKKRNTVTTFDKSSQHLKNPFKVYQLDFGGRVTQESAKNFQIEYLGKQVCAMNYFVLKVSWQTGLYLEYILSYNIQQKTGFSVERFSGFNLL